MLIDVREIAGLSRRYFGEDGSVKSAQPIIDVAHGRRAISLIVAHDSTVLELHVARIEKALIAKYGHQATTTAATERFLHSSIITSEIGITVENKKPIGQQGQCLPYRAGSSEQNRSVEGILKLDSDVGTVAEALLNTFTEIANSEHDAPHAVSLEEFELMPKKRLACDIYQSFRNSIGERPQPCGLASSQNDDRHEFWGMVIHERRCACLQNQTGSGLLSILVRAWHGADELCHSRRTSENLHRQLR